MSLTELVVDAEYEKTYERELSLSGSYIPVKGIRGLGWDGWKDLPEADFAMDLVRWHNDFMREHMREPYYLHYRELFEVGEITIPEMRRIFSNYYSFVDNMFPWEGIIIHRAQEMHAREARDLILTHMYEEGGHAELLANYCEKALGLDRVRDVYAPSDRRQSNYLGPDLDYFRRIYEKGTFVDAGVLMLAERDLPKAMRTLRVSLEKVYNMNPAHLVYFDVHSYIDIYHERYGLYIIAKYARDKEIRRRAEEFFKSIIMTRYEAEKRTYSTLECAKR